MTTHARASVWTLYSRSNCPLCDELKDHLMRLGVRFTECDISTRRDWYENYKYRVPVLRSESGKEYDPPFDSSALRRLLADSR